MRVEVHFRVCRGRNLVRSPLWLSDFWFVPAPRLINVRLDARLRKVMHKKIVPAYIRVFPWCEKNSTPFYSLRRRDPVEGPVGWDPFASDPIAGRVRALGKRIVVRNAS